MEKTEKEILVCKTPGMQLWMGLQKLGKKEFGREPDIFPYPTNPECKCNWCVTIKKKENYE